MKKKSASELARENFEKPGMEVKMFYERLAEVCKRSVCATCKCERLCMTAPKSLDEQTIEKTIAMLRDDSEQYEQKEDD